MSVAVWNILDIDEEAGEEGVNALISDFTTKRMNEEGIPEALNPDIEEFLKHNALQFAREKKSITYLASACFKPRFESLIKCSEKPQ